MAPMTAMDWNGVPLQPLSGGYSGETFLAGDSSDAERAAVVRIYRREPQRAAIDASLLRLVRGLLPVPEVLELVPADAGNPGVLVTEYIDGTPLEMLLAADPPELDYETLGLNLGWVLGVMSGIPFIRMGMFADPELSLTMEGMPSDLAEWAQHFRDTGRLAAWAQRDWEALLDLVDQAQGILDQDVEENGRFVLVHSDFNPKNIRVDPIDGDIVGLLDWEFAHAGSPHTDFGNFTRFERDDRLIEPLVEGFVDVAPGHIRDPFTKGRAADLWALLELAGGTRTNDVRELASELLLAQARAGDLYVWPWDSARVDPARDRQIS